MSNQEEEILRTANSWKVPESRTKDEVWNAIEKQIAVDENELQPRTFRKSMVAAAITLVTLGLAYQLFWQTTAVETNMAESKELTLPDGTNVSLNARSKLSYHTSSFKKNRALDFEGEGFFDVKKGDSFTINLNGVQVTVLGTSFNIYARDETNEVKCLTGKVSVSDSQRSVILGPGQSISSKNGVVAKEPGGFNLEEAISWREGKFLFTNAPFTRVVRELEIQFGVTVISNEMEDRFYTGYFDNSNLEKAVRQVFSPMGYTYKIEENKILIE